MKMEQSVSKRRHIKFSRRGITQKKAYVGVCVLCEVGNKFLYVIEITVRIRKDK